MRAREFIVESQSELNPFYADPMKYTYILPDVKSSDPYQVYRLGVAFARARAEQDPTAVFDQEWATSTAFSNDAVIVGFNDTVAQVIDRGLEMIGKPPNKKLVSTPESSEPQDTGIQSPVKSFKGYPR